MLAPELLFAIEKTVHYRGDAFDLRTGKFLYSENHTEFYRNGVHTHSYVSYRDAAGKEFAHKKVNFVPEKTQPSFELFDSRDGYTEGIRRENGKTIYYARRKAEEPLKSKAVVTPKPAVFDAGFDYFVRENFGALCSGKILSFYFAVPVELDYFAFRISQKGSGEKCLLYLELDNFFLRQLVKPVKLWYDNQTRRLLQYEGISNINGPDGKSLRVRIVFRYPENP